jgi:hypothetical protein
MAGWRKPLLRTGSALAIAITAAGLTLASATGAGASGSGSPPVAQVPTSCSTSSTVTVQSSNSPQTVSLGETCAFTPNSAVTVTYGGTVVASPTADSNGLITLAVTATDPSLSIDGSAPQSAVYGTNTITASGTNASGATNTATFLVDLVQASSPTTAASTTSSGGLAFTGADLAALIGAALILILLGVGVVTFTRRRAANHTPES